MNRVLIPLDGSPLSEAVLPVAEEWAKEEEAEVILLRAALAGHLPGADSTEAEVRVVTEGEAYLKEIAGRLTQRGLRRVRWAVWYDEPATAIAEAVASYGVDLIAMATHGRSGLSRALLGSVAEAVVRAVRVPVLLLRGQSAWKPWATGKILVPLDGSEQAGGILPVVERLAGPRDLTLSLLEVIEPAPPPVVAAMASNVEEMMAVWRKEAQEYLVKVADPLSAKGVRVEWEIKVGQPAESIAAVAAESRADLIAMATHGRSGLGRLFFGSVAETVLRSASVPVLLFRAAGGR
jgi:nucleotide-binding universal stress UspA family protein